MASPSEFTLRFLQVFAATYLGTQFAEELIFTQLGAASNQNFL